MKQLLPNAQLPSSTAVTATQQTLPANNCGTTCQMCQQDKTSKTLPTQNPTALHCRTHNPTAPQHCREPHSTTAPRSKSTAEQALQHRSTAALHTLHSTAETPQHHSTAEPSAAAPQHCRKPHSTTEPRSRSTAEQALQHRSTAENPAALQNPQHHTCSSCAQRTYNCLPPPRAAAAATTTAPEAR
jgi:hypothetical protein